MRTKDIVVLPYQKEWKEDFQAIARELQIALGEQQNQLLILML